MTIAGSEQMVVPKELLPYLRQMTWVLALAMLWFAVSLTQARAEYIDPADGRMAWQVGQADGVANQYVRDSGRSSVCDFGIWDKGTYFAEAVFCETLSGWYWKQSYMTIDLVMDEFGHLKDFITSGPEPFREISSTVGSVDLYGFNLDRPGGDGIWQCIVFIKGFSREDRGYQQMLMAYACDDTDQALTQNRLSEVLAGLSINGVFEAFAE